MTAARDSCDAACIRFATKTVPSWTPLLRNLFAASLQYLPLAHVLEGGMSPPFLDEEPIVGTLREALRKGSLMNICDPPPRFHELVVPQIPVTRFLTNVIRVPIEQKDAVLSFRMGRSAHRWQAFCEGRLANAFDCATVFPTEVWDSIFEALCVFPKHVAMVWVKTISNGWTTSHRMHEDIIHRCFFCDQERDSLRHYARCPGLAHLVSVAVGDALPIPPRDVLSFFSLPVVDNTGISRLFVAYTCYHTYRHAYTSLAAAGHSDKQRVLLGLAFAARRKWDLIVPASAAQ